VPPLLERCSAIHGSDDKDETSLLARSVLVITVLDGKSKTWKEVGRWVNSLCYLMG